MTVTAVDRLIAAIEALSPTDVANDKKVLRFRMLDDGAEEIDAVFYRDIQWSWLDCIESWLGIGAYSLPRIISALRESNLFDTVDVDKKHYLERILNQRIEHYNAKHWLLSIDRFSFDKSVAKTQAVAVKRVAFAKTVTPDFRVDAENTLHTPQDGNCLYHAFGCILQKKPEELRFEVSDYLRANFEEDSYLAQTIRDAVWDVNGGLTNSYYRQLQDLFHLFKSKYRMLGIEAAKAVGEILQPAIQNMKSISVDELCRIVDQAKQHLEAMKQNAQNAQFLARIDQVIAEFRNFSHYRANFEKEMVAAKIPEATDNEAISNYIERVKWNRFWGGVPELIALSKLYNAQVNVTYIPDGKRVRVVHEELMSRLAPRRPTGEKVIPVELDYYHENHWNVRLK